MANTYPVLRPDRCRQLRPVHRKTQGPTCDPVMYVHWSDVDPVGSLVRLRRGSVRICLQCRYGLLDRLYDPRVQAIVAREVQSVLLRFTCINRTEVMDVIWGAVHLLRE